MGESSLPEWSEVDGQIRRLALACTPAELHGALCGWLAAGGRDGGDWLQTVMVEPALPRPAAGDPLDCLHAASVEQLGDPGFGFKLLLPDGTPLGVRAEALFAWCRGFLGGFGLAVGETALSDEGREALHDLGNLAAAHMDDEGDSDDEAALAEIEEYLRVAVLLLHADCTLKPRPDRRLN